MGLPPALTATLPRLRPRRHLRRHRGPHHDVPWRQAVFSSLDLETTGLDLHRDRIVSIGMVRIESGRIRTEQASHLLVNPGRPVPAGSILIHAIRTQDLFDCPTAEERAPQIAAAAAGSTLVAHAAWVERAFLGRELPTATTRALAIDHIIDTAALSRALGIRSRSEHEPALERLSIDLGLPVHTPHEALGDAITTAQVFCVLATRLEALAGRPLTVGDLCRLTRRHRSA